MTPGGPVTMHIPLSRFMSIFTAYFPSTQGHINDAHRVTACHVNLYHRVSWGVKDANEEFSTLACAQIKESNVLSSVMGTDAKV